MQAVLTWLGSRTVIASIVGILITLARALNFEELAGVDEGALTDALYSIATGVAFVAAIVFRVRARKQADESS